MSYQFYYKSKLARNRGEVLEHLQSQKANSSRLSQPKQSSKNQPSKSHRRKISRRRLTKPLSAARNRPTAATIINGTTRAATEFFKARRQEREKRLAAIGGFKRPDTASARRGSRAMTISASTPALSSRGIVQMHHLNPSNDCPNPDPNSNPAPALNSSQTTYMYSHLLL